MLRTIVFVECVVCVTWDDDLRTQSKQLYHRLHLIGNSLGHFKVFLKVNSVFRANEIEWLTGNLSIFPSNLIYEHYEADTEADKVAPHQ